MMKKAYEKPTMNVVKIQQQTQILAGSIQELRGRAKSSEEPEDTWYDLE